MTNGFNPTRLVAARQRRGLTQARLAGLTCTTPQTIARYERGETTPSESMVDSLADALGFPRPYFEYDDPPLITSDRPSFRALQSMTSGIRDRALGAACIAIELERTLDAHFDLPRVDVPDLHHLDPEGAAMALRERWGIGVRPIPNMVLLLEKHGIRTFSLNEDYTSLRAFCLWEGDLPFVFLSHFATTEMARFNAAHELGHLVLHRHAVNAGKQAEKQANEFASAFLMPRSSVLGACKLGMSFDELLVDKKRWGVSAAALAYRLHSPQINLLSDWQYKRIAIELSRRDRHVEPNPIESRETSWVLNAILTELKKERKGWANLVPHLPPFDVHELTFRLGFAVVWQPSGHHVPGTP